MRMIRTILLCLMLVTFATPLWAEDKTVETMQTLVEKIKTDKRQLVTENMQFTERESKAFWPLYDKYQSELFLLRIRMLALINDYAAAYDTMTNSTAKKLLDEAMTIESLRLKLSKTYLPEFRKVLPDTKVARYYQIESKVNAAIAYELASKIPLVKAEKQ